MKQKISNGENNQLHNGQYLNVELRLLHFNQTRQTKFHPTVSRHDCARRRQCFLIPANCGRWACRDVRSGVGKCVRGCVRVLLPTRRRAVVKTEARPNPEQFGHATITFDLIRASRVIHAGLALHVIRSSRVIQAWHYT